MLIRMPGAIDMGTLIDVTVVNVIKGDGSVAHREASTKQGYMAKEKEKSKAKKYGDIPKNASFTYTTCAIELFGAMGEEFRTLVKKVAYTDAAIRANQGSLGVTPIPRSPVTVTNDQIINSVNPVTIGQLPLHAMSMEKTYYAQALRRAFQCIEFVQWQNV